eukprot:5632172-Lingulodinium_polyedra.AAC.1
MHQKASNMRSWHSPARASASTLRPRGSQRSRGAPGRVRSTWRWRYQAFTMCFTSAGASRASSRPSTQPSSSCESVKQQRR